MYYHWCMEKQQENGQSVLGTEDQQVKDERAIPTVSDLERAIKRDTQSAIALLNAILTDTDMLNHMAIFVKGRLSNAANKPKPDA